MMILVTIKMPAIEKKRMELLQTVESMIECTRLEKGCLSHHLYRSVEDDNTFEIVEEWESQTDLDNRLRSDRFRALLGAIHLFCDQPEIKLYTVTSTSGMKKVERIKSA